MDMALNKPNKTTLKQTLIMPLRYNCVKINDLK